MIRRATPADAEAIAELEALSNPQPWATDQVAATLTTASGQGWVRLQGECLVGHLLASRVADEAEVLLLAVHPDHRRRGCATALLQAAEAAWRLAGVRAAWLEVRADNHGARALYTAAGWESAGTRHRYYADNTDAVLLRRILDDAPGGPPRTS